MGLLALTLAATAANISRLQAAPPETAQQVCSARVTVGYARCFAWVQTGISAEAVKGLSPAKIKKVYNFPTSMTAGTGQTVAIVDAFDDPTAEHDLNTFSSQFGLPACTTANGCFKKVNQVGGATYPATNGDWALEISLDTQWAHAIAPGAHILLVEATTNSTNNLLAAEDYAKNYAHYISNSWGSNEYSSERTHDSHFIKSGVSFFFSSGDSGTPAQYPSSAPNVISVGGTRLNNIGRSNFSETGWKDSGGGCSKYENANPAQVTNKVKCKGKRATPDVSLDADPASGVAVYDNTCYYENRVCYKGWFVVGGTSASCPMWAARSADAGVAVDAAYVYASNIAFRDIKSGNNGAPALKGYDLVTGRGSWTGTAP